MCMVRNMKLADLLRNQSAANLEQKYVKNTALIVEKVRQRAKQASLDGKFSVMLDHSELFDKKLQALVKTQLAEDGFWVYFYDRDYDDGMGCGAVYHYVEVSWK